MAVLRTIFLLGLGLACAAAVSAADATVSENDNNSFPQFSLPSIDIYPGPETPTPHAGDNIKTCVALDDEIVDLMPLTYRTVPDFYNDPKVAAAIWLTTTGVVLFDFHPDNFPLTEIPFGYALLAYPEYKRYKEEERIRRVSLRIESLRRSKARQRCFET